MALIDYVGAASARVLGSVALIPAWVALQRYTFPYFTGGPLVLTVDVLRATLYPMLWITLAWLLLNPKTTRHFLYRREDQFWRFVFGTIYLIAVPFVVLTALDRVSTYWLQHTWIADVLMAALVPTWLGFLLAFAVPGGYARNIADERDEALDDTRHWSDNSRNQAADRAYTERLIEQGISLNEVEHDAAREQWRQRVLERQDTQNEVRQARHQTIQQKTRRNVVLRLAIGAVFLAVVAAGVKAVSDSRDLARYLPVIIGGVLVIGFMVANVVLSARSANPLSRAFRIVGLVVILGLLANLVFVPASSRLFAGLYADFIADAVNSIKDIGQNWGG